MSETSGGTIVGTGVEASPWMRRWVTAVVVLVFGPYLIGGLRTEHVAVYGSAIVMLGLVHVHLLRVLRPAAPVLLLWGAYAGVAITASFFAGNQTPWPSGSLVAGMDNALMPLAALSVATFWAAQPGRGDLLRVAAWTLIVCLCVNSAVAVVTMYLGLDALPGLSLFWSSEGDRESVAVLAEQMGRFSGVFNQPAEAGIAYTLGAIALLHRTRSADGPPGWREHVAWALIIVGGLVTLSKVFVVGGAVLVLMMVAVPGRHRSRMVLAGAAVVSAFSALAFAGKAGSWGASVMFNWYRVSVQTGDSPLYTLTAGRLGTPGTNGPPSISAAPSLDLTGTSGTSEPLPVGLAESMGEMFEHHPWFGVGARGLQVAYDSTWTEVVIVGGGVGLVLVALVHLGLGHAWVRSRGRVSKEEWLLGGVLLVLVAGSSVGMPSLTGNREGTLLWLFMGLLLMRPKDSRRIGDVPERVRAVRLSPLARRG